MYKCKKCDKEFLTKSHLTKHIENVHEGLKRFKCDSCGESFSQSGELRRHMAKIHDGETDGQMDKQMDKQWTNLYKDAPFSKVAYLGHHGQKMEAEWLVTCLQSLGF